jgi:iron complex outermembrane receptor protein
MNVGVRGDRSSGYGSFFSPSVSAAWQILPALQLRTSGARGFRAPTWTERYYADPSSIGNPALRPERFWSGDAGIRLKAASVAVDVAGYTRVADALIDWVKPAGSTSTTPWRATNIGTATYRGFEAHVQLPTFHRVDYSVYGSGVTLDASEGAALIGKYALRPITRQIGVRAGHRLTDAAEVNFDLVDARRANEPSYLTGNARFRWQRDRARLTLDVANLTNAGWRDASGQPAAGRVALVGLAWTGR